MGSMSNLKKMPGTERSLTVVDWDVTAYWFVIIVSEDDGESMMLEAEVEGEEEEGVLGAGVRV